MKKEFIQASITEKANDGSFTAVASSPRVDRHGESVDQKGWDLKNFKKNPVLLWAHDHTIPAIGVAKRVWISDGKLMFKGVWQEVTDMGKAAKKLVEDGIINSFSVGFLPSEMDGNTYTKQELLEISLVNVPANPDAMMLAYKSLKEEGLKDEVIKGFGIPVEVLDKVQTLSKDVDSLSQKVQKLEKAQTPAAPQAQDKKLRTKQSVVKAIVKSADQLIVGEKHQTLGKEDRVQLAKIIKRGAEILSKSHKEQIKNG